MNIYVYDETLQLKGVLDAIKSVIWHEKYCGTGDFDLQLPVEVVDKNILHEDTFLARPDSKTVMVVERIELKTDEENGDTWVITGRSAEALLDRRVVWNQMNLNGNVIREAGRIVRENIVAPAQLSRAMPLLQIGEQAELSETITKQLMGEVVLDALTEILQTYGLGFSLLLDNSKGIFLFCIQKGTNRSRDNPENMPVVFSENMDNLLQSDYVEDYTTYKNVCLVGGEGEGTARRFSEIGTASGMKRREMFYDGSSISSNEGEVSESDYKQMLVEAGKEQIEQVPVLKTFTGEIDNAGTYIYDRDYFLGDVVTLENAYGISANVRITDVTKNSDDTGETVVLSYESIE